MHKREHGLGLSFSDIQTNAVHPQPEAESSMLLGNRLNAALLRPHAPAWSIFINLFNNLFFFHIISTRVRASAESLAEHEPLPNLREMWRQ